jgi:hypothetical protein
MILTSINQRNQFLNCQEENTRLLKSEPLPGGGYDKRIRAMRNPVSLKAREALYQPPIEPAHEMSPIVLKSNLLSAWDRALGEAHKQFASRQSCELPMWETRFRQRADRRNCDLIRLSAPVKSPITQPGISSVVFAGIHRNTKSQCRYPFHDCRELFYQFSNETSTPIQKTLTLNQSANVDSETTAG